MRRASWMPHLGDHHAKVPLPSLDHADWSRGLALGADATAAPPEGASLPSPQSTFAEGLLSTANIALHGEISVLAVEPVLGYLAVGTTVGSIHLFGRASVQLDWTLRPANKVQHLLFKSGSPLLVAIDAKDNISVFDLSRNDPQVRTKVSAAAHPFQPAPSTTTGAGPSGPLHPDTPMRIGAQTARNSILCAELSPLHSHLFLGLRDGTLDTYDLERLCSSTYRVPNLWWEEEEILRKSGVPDAPNRRHVPLIVDIKTHPKDINQLLLAYEGGVVLLDVKQRNVLKSFQLRHLPGAVGAGVGNPELMWTERAAPMTCVAWRPDGILFACGHEDGCISIWHAEDDEKPVMVRTLESIDVDKPDPAMFEAQNGPAMGREPIFKLSWSGFPLQPWIRIEKAAAAARQGQPPQVEEDEPATGTVLTILGGATERHPPGLVCLHFPAFSWPYSSYWNPSSAEATAKTRQALRMSIMETNGSRYATPSAVEDFILLPRESPYYGLAYDPVAVVTLLSADPLLPPLPPPAAARGLKAFAFPPPADSNDALRLPPGSKPASRIGMQLPFPQRPLNLPLALSTAGSGAILGADLINLSHHAYRILIGATNTTLGNTHTSAAPSSAVQAASSSQSFSNDLPLRGGKATPTASGIGAETQEAFATLARAEHWRVLVTWHLDGTVRFHDASPHLLLLGNSQGASISKETDRSTDSSPGLLEQAFPQPLPHLTIDTRQLIHSPGMNGHLVFEKLRSDPMRLRIASVHCAAEALEVAVVLRTGQVLHFKYGLARFSETEDFNEAVSEEVQQDEEMAADFARHQRSPSVSQHSTQELDSAMAGALSDLDVSRPRRADGQYRSPPLQSSNGPGAQSMSPPPRPRRDPKRASGMRKLGLGRMSQERSSGEQGSVPSPPSSTGYQSSIPPSLGSMPVEEITQVGHLATWHVDGFKPNIVIELARGEVTALETSDIGFLSIACGSALAIVDLRGPDILIREGFGDQAPPSNRTESREERKMIEEESKSAVKHLRMSICRTATASNLSPTLIVTRESGYVTLWTLSKSGLDIWMAERSHGIHLDELSKCVNTQVVDMAGNVCHALPSELQRSLREQARGAIDDVSRDMNSLLCVGQKTITLRMGLTGPRVSKADVGERVHAAGVVDRRGEKVCLAISATSIWVYSLPHLRLLRRLQRHNRSHEERLSIAMTTTALDQGGDFMEVANSLDISMWTIFATMPRPGLPSLLLYTPPSMPIAPNAIGSVASGFVNWIGGKSSALTQGAQLDEMLAGPKRAEAPKLPEPKSIQIQVEEQRRREMQGAAERGGSIPSGALHPRSAHRPQGSGGSGSRAASTAQETQGAAGTAAWTADLARQRGEMMNNLEQGLSSLERGASSWMKSAREEMVKQAAKDKISKIF